EANKKLISDLERLEPFGCANESPKFIVEDATLVKPPAILKERHTRLTVFSQGTIKPVIFFNRPDVYKALHKAQDANFDLAARVVKNEWQGSVSIELRGIDLRIRDNK
ncbi:hypothetical protein HOD08_01845, partial [bacterium]|nr:hypothetical protein [bacterium]